MNDNDYYNTMDEEFDSLLNLIYEQRFYIMVDKLIRIQEYTSAFEYGVGDYYIGLIHDTRWFVIIQPEERNTLL